MRQAEQEKSVGEENEYAFSTLAQYVVPHKETPDDKIERSETMVSNDLKSLNEVEGRGRRDTVNSPNYTESHVCIFNHPLCKHGGICEKCGEEGLDFKCKCKEGYSGRHCEERGNPEQELLHDWYKNSWIQLCGFVGLFFAVCMAGQCCCYFVKRKSRKGTKKSSKLKQEKKEMESVMTKSILKPTTIVTSPAEGSLPSRVSEQNRGQRDEFEPLETEQELEGLNETKELSLSDIRPPRYCPPEGGNWLE